MNMQDQKLQPILILIRGMPGSGKSYLATCLQTALGSQHVVMLDPDAIDFKSEAYAKHVAAMRQEGVDPVVHPYRFLKAQACEGIAAGKIIIWNQPFTNLGMFQRMTASLEAYAVEHNAQLQILVVEVEIDRAVATERVVQRKQAGGHGPSENTLAQRMNEYVSYASEGYNTVTVHGDEDAQISVNTVIQAVKGLSKI